MLRGACRERAEEQRAYHVDKWMAAVHSGGRCDHHFYVAPVGVDRLVVASRSLSDDPVLRSMGSAVYFSGYRYVSIIQGVSRSPDAVVVTEPALPRALFCSGHGMAGRLYFYRIFLTLSPLLG